jgi:hypothetical protein
VYLPDEGERNCYSGLASNWSILDGAVGTIAEHTSALSDKAPLVHTHSKLDITDFPAYGNTAGTICEGNDSRLSDARTPVAHTHTKSDFTDLLNSNFIPSANNSYDLGSSSYQWNNVYSKGYYYNGTAWGLDKSNEWSANNSFYGMTIYGSTTNTFQSNSSAGEKGDASVFALNIQAQDKNHAGWSSSGVANIGLGQDSNGSYVSFALDTKDSNNTRRNNALSFLLRPTDNSHNAYFFPNRDNTVELGTSTNKWKTLNGINPGALSLPNYDDTTYIDISGSIVPPSGETEINKNLGHNEYTPPVDGWLSIRCDGATFLQIYRNSYNCPGITSCDPSGGKLVVTLPVRKNVTYTIRIKTSGTTNIYQLYPCLGNV